MNTAPIVQLTDPSLLASMQHPPIDLDALVDWSRGVDRNALPKAEDQAWLYGTPEWDALNAGEKREMLWNESAQIASDFIWLKEGLSQLFTRMIDRFGARVPEEIRAAMEAFRARQLVYAEMFRRYLDAANLPLVPRPEFMDFVAQIERNHPIGGLLCTFAMESSLAETARRMNGTDALTREVYAANDVEERRHLAFAKSLCEHAIHSATMIETKVRIGYLVRGYMKVVMQRLTFNAPADRATLRRIWRTENNLRLNRERCGAVLAWIKELGLVPAHYDWSEIDESALPLVHFTRQKGLRRAAVEARKATAS